MSSPAGWRVRVIFIWSLAHLFAPIIPNEQSTATEEGNTVTWFTPFFWRALIFASGDAGEEGGRSGA